jgi:hypothetical protein
MVQPPPVQQPPPSLSGNAHDDNKAAGSNALPLFNLATLQATRAKLNSVSEGNSKPEMLTGISGRIVRSSSGSSTSGSTSSASKSTSVSSPTGSGSSGASYNSQNNTTKNNPINSAKNNIYPRGPISFRSSHFPESTVEAAETVEESDVPIFQPTTTIVSTPLTSPTAATAAKFKADVPVMHVNTQSLSFERSDNTLDNFPDKTVDMTESTETTETTKLAGKAEHEMSASEHAAMLIAKANARRTNNTNITVPPPKPPPIVPGTSNTSTPSTRDPTIDSACTHNHNSSLIAKTSSSEVKSRESSASNIQTQISSSSIGTLTDTSIVESSSVSNVIASNVTSGSGFAMEPGNEESIVRKYSNGIFGGQKKTATYGSNQETVHRIQQ